MKQVVAVVMAAAIVFVAIRAIKAQFEFSEDDVVAVNVASKISLTIEQGADKLKNTIPEFSKIPYMVDEMYGKLAENHGLVQAGFAAAGEALLNVQQVKKEIGGNKMITMAIKTPLVNALDTLGVALSALYGVLNDLNQAFMVTIQEREATKAFLTREVEVAKAGIEGKDERGRDLPTRMKALADFIRVFNK